MSDTDWVQCGREEAEGVRYRLTALGGHAPSDWSGWHHSDNSTRESAGFNYQYRKKATIAEQDQAFKTNQLQDSPDIKKGVVPREKGGGG